MAKAQTYAGRLLDLHVEGDHLLLQTDLQGDLVQTAPFCSAIIAILLSQDGLICTKLVS